jgi:DNA-binding MarR family transcriptional regulator
MWYGRAVPKRKPTSAVRAELLARLHTAGRESSTAAVMFHASLAALQGLSATETKAIDVLDRQGPLTAGELAARTGLAPPSVTGLINRLERKGFARRIEDPEDRRRVRVEPCPTGMAKLTPLFADFGTQIDALYAEFTDDQLQTILHFMTEVTRRQHDATARLASLAADTPPATAK